MKDHLFELWATALYKSPAQRFSGLHDGQFTTMVCSFPIIKLVYIFSCFENATHIQQVCQLPVFSHVPSTFQLL